MEVFCISFLLFILTISLIFEKKVYAPTVIFNAVWFLVILLASMRLYELNGVSEDTYLMVLVGVLAFNLGALCRSFFKIKLSPSSTKSLSGSFAVNYNFLMVFYAIIILFTGFLAMTSIRLLLSGVAMSSIRDGYSNVESGLVIASYGGYRFEVYVVAPAEFSAVALLPIIAFEERSRKKRVLLLELIIFLSLHLFVTGARSFFIDVVFLFVVYSLMNKRKTASVFNSIKRRTRSSRFWIFVIIALSFGAVILMSLLRKGDKSDFTFAREIYRYFAISLPLFEKHLELSVMEGHTGGWVLLYGFIRPPLSLLHSIGLPFPAGLEKATELINANDLFYSVGGGKANSFVTLFYSNYMDFGIASLIIYTMLHGYIANNVYLNMKRNNNIKSQCFYLLIAVGVFLSFTRSLFTAYRYVYAFLIVFLAFKRVKAEEIGI